VVSHWLAQIAPPPHWVLDPFGAAPRLAVEAAHAGYQVLVSANNPIARFLLEIEAGPPSRDDLRAALSLLASSRIGEQRLEPYILSLYQSECAQCGQPLNVHTFIWERGGSGPVARIYDCRACGDNGERPTTAADLRRAQQISVQAHLHQARALERVAALNDPDRAHAEEALTVYLPRAVNTLFTLINGIDGLNLTPIQHACLRLLLLGACDEGNTLWPTHTARWRPKQLNIPTRFFEHNIWLSLEQAIEQWQTSKSPIPVQMWSSTPADAEPGSLHLYEGRLKDLAPQLDGVPIAAVIAPLPRPNQAYWTLSALWAGWLWGRAAVGPFKSVLRRRRYDWGWHATALHAAFQSLRPHLQDGTPILGLIGEDEPGFLASACLAFQYAGYTLNGLAIRPESDQAQLIASARQTTPGVGEIEDAGLLPVMHEYLRRRGEPSPYRNLHAAALSRQVYIPAQANEEEDAPARALSSIQNQVQESLTYRSGFLRYGGTAASVETGHWWLRDPHQVDAPLADRCEIALVRYLIENPDCTFDKLEMAVLKALPGLFTPEPSLIYAILDSYAERPDEIFDRWNLRSEDAPSRRRNDIQNMSKLLNHLGERIGFQVAGENPVIWEMQNAQTAYTFYLLASANISKYVYAEQSSPKRSILVLPGGRANLVLFKLKRDPHLDQVVQEGWRFLKFRHLLRITDDSSVTSETFASQLDLDPLTYTTPQIRFF
jgi:hypothetical protein